MIEINLLPEKLRVKKKEALKLPTLPVIPLAIGIVGFLIAVQVVLIILIQTKNLTLNSLNNKLSAISASNLQAIDLENRVKGISFRVGAIEKLANSRLRFAKKLNDLSDSIVPGVWLKAIDVRKGESSAEPGLLREVLVIEGSSIVSGNKEEGSIGKFVNSLKENKSFSDDFDDIDLTKVERKKIKNTEVMDFVIICYFKKGRI